MGIEDVVFTKARHISLDEMAKSAWVYRHLRRFRAGGEGVIGYFKYAFGLRRIMRRGYDAFIADVWASVVSANLLTLARHRIGVT